MDEKKYRVVNRDPKPGDLIRLLTDGGYPGATPSSVAHVVHVLPCGKGWVSVRATEVNPQLLTPPSTCWVFVLGKSCELVEEVKPPEYDPDDVKLTRPAEDDEDDEDGYPVTLKEVGDLSAFAFLHSVREYLQTVTFTADGDIVAEFK